MKFMTIRHIFTAFYWQLWKLIVLPLKYYYLNINVNFFNPNIKTNKNMLLMMMAFQRVHNVQWDFYRDHIHIQHTKLSCETASNDANGIIIRERGREDKPFHLVWNVSLWVISDYAWQQCLPTHEVFLCLIWYFCCWKVDSLDW